MAMEEGEEREAEERVVTRMTTRDMQMETGVRMRMISSPTVSRMVAVVVVGLGLGLGFGIGIGIGSIDGGFGNCGGELGF